ncbi:MAG TPA: APC family permease [Actinomycetota bacterium]|nr:APC family permease [Actinomycetota bacterium]
MRVATLPPRRRRSLLKRLLVGRAMASARLEHTLLPKVLALPVFSSDALSSVAYATEEILFVLLQATAAAAAARYVMPIALAIAALMAIVVSSYRQTVRAYPSGGGAYIVSKENLGTLPGLVAAAALLTDYVLTVAVSVAAGVFAITSARPSLLPYRVELALALVAFITLANLRGVRESGTLFAVPTYAFIASILAMVAVGIARCAAGCPAASPVPPHPDLAAAAGPVGAFTILRAFSSGSTALTGVEAISNGVPAFRRPQAKNAADTLAMMGAIAIAMFLGISFLATHIPGITVSEERSVVAQIADAVFGGGVGFYVVQAFTAAILVLAANTAYQDFPRLSAILARDRFMPRQFMNRGDRLVFSNGVLALATLAGVLLVAFDAEVTRLIQLYVVGVFTSFTLSQFGMVRHWLRERDRGEAAARGWRRAMAINAVGGLTTGVVLVVITATKFRHGAWIVIAAIPVIVSGFLSVHRHYASVARQLRRGAVRPGEVGANHVVLLVLDVDAAVAEALGYVRSFRPRSLRAVTPVREPGALEDLRGRWRALLGAPGPELEPLPAGPDLLGAVRAFLGTIPREPPDFVTVVVPELVGEPLGLYLVRRRALVRLKAGLLRERGVVVTDVPVLVEEGRPVAVDARPLIPTRTVALVFVAGVHDATIRAVNYARSLGAQETRAVYFSLDPDEAGRIEEEWERADPGIPLDVVEAPFRDLTGPILEEVRRVTARPEAVCAVILPEFVVARWRHLLLHNQNALFVKRLLLTEPRVVLSSVPYPLEEERWTARRRSRS